MSEVLPTESRSPEKFDAYADQYRSLMDASVQDSGESAEYFAQYKVKCLLRFGAPTSEPIVDFGAGTGSLTEQLVREFRSVWAYEPSTASLQHTRRRASAAVCTCVETDL